MRKAIVFVDANNWYHNVKKSFSPGEIDIIKISNLLCNIKKYDLVEVRWYASTPSIADGESMYYKHMSFLENLEKQGVKVITRKLQRLSNKEVLNKKKETIENLDLCKNCEPLIKDVFLDLADPKQFLVYLKNKERQVEEILPELVEKQNKFKEKQEAEIFDGLKGISTAMSMMIEDARKGDEFLIFTLDVGSRNEEIQEFYTKFGIRRKAKGIITKVIYHINLKPILQKRKDMKIRYTSMPTPSNMGICKDKVMMVSWGKKPRCVLINSKEIADSQRQFFNALWKVAKS